MKYFLASTILDYSSRSIIKENNFLENLKNTLDENIRLLFISSSPKEFDINDKYFNELKNALLLEDISIETSNILDDRNIDEARSLINNSNLIFLAGGHVLTQNKFFERIDLKNLLLNYDKVLISSSAGSMNSAEVVYSIPELDGEAIDKKFKKFLKGLGITKLNIIPHFQFIKNEIVDNCRVIDDIVLKDSYNNKFYALDDGSYIMGQRDKFEKIIGNSYLIENGKINNIR